MPQHFRASMKLAVVLVAVVAFIGLILVICPASAGGH